ncbi:MAG: hypothetical protein HFP81_04765 [Methylococcales symbiont of Hymedesmia sp. n. MRB-2018]|nr:MAG: hypothetical protein HFP81_04765 [Methylococcales symbiont of Hymedesmia sp. n. MRB-2018]
MKISSSIACCISDTSITQTLTFYAEDEKSIGSVYANGDLLNLGRKVMKNVACYDVSRLLVGSKGKLALITQISFKVMPKVYISKIKKPHLSKSDNPILREIEQKLKWVFDPRRIF